MTTYRFIETKDNKVIIQKKVLWWGWVVLTEDGFGYGEDDSCPLEFSTLDSATDWLYKQHKQQKILQILTIK